MTSILRSTPAQQYHFRLMNVCNALLDAEEDPATTPEQRAKLEQARQLVEEVDP